MIARWASASASVMGCSSIGILGGFGGGWFGVVLCVLCSEVSVPMRDGVLIEWARRCSDLPVGFIRRVIRGRDWTVTLSLRTRLHRRSAGVVAWFAVDGVGIAPRLPRPPQINDNVACFLREHFRQP
jgi:hypothetical protein